MGEAVKVAAFMAAKIPCIEPLSLTLLHYAQLGPIVQNCDSGAPAVG